jgi:hypothetical protein
LEHEAVPKEEAVVKIVTALKKQYRDQPLTLKRHGQLKKGTQGNDGSQKKLAAACRGITQHAGVAWLKGHGHEGLTIRGN